jgi:hypothetical protein
MSGWKFGLHGGYAYGMWEVRRFGFSDDWVIRRDGDYIRSSNGSILRFKTAEAAMRRAEKLMEKEAKKK